MNADDQLKEFTGTANYYRHALDMLFTDGVKELCDRFECWWLLWVVISYQPNMKQHEFQVWKLMVNEDESAVIKCADGNGNLLVKQEISFTDFKAKRATIWIEG